MAEQQQHSFGTTNVWVVDEMYREYLADPESVGESWQEFFSDYTPAFDPGGAGNGRAATAAPPAPSRPAPPPTEERPARKPAPAQRPEGDGELPPGAKPLRGVSSVIAENMETSLGVPTATSMRVVP